MTAPHLAAGQIVAGKYTVRALLGFTSEVATYEASDARGALVALKLYDPALGQRADIMTRLEQTHARVAALPSHLVVPVFDSGYDVGTSAPFTVCERLQLPSLAKLVETGPLSVDVVAAVVRAAASALDQAHAQRFHHHAIKPTNLFVGPAPGYATRIADFGASVVHSTSPTHEAYARLAPWWAPEQLQPAAVLGPATDVFAMALVTFYALTGRSYWLSCQGSPPDLSRWQTEIMGARVPPSQRAAELGVNVPAQLDGALARALSVSQTDRPASAMEIAQLLAPAAGAGVSAVALAAGVQPLAVSPAQVEPSPMGVAPGPALGAGGPAPPVAPVGSPGQSPGGYAAVAPVPPVAAAVGPAYAAVAADGSPALASGGQLGAAAPGGEAAQAAAMRDGPAVTPGLPPVAPTGVKKRPWSLLPVVVGVMVAVLVGTAGLAFLFTRSSESDALTAAASASVEPSAAGSAAPAASATATASASAVVDGGSPDAGEAPEGATVAVEVKCVPSCGTLWIDNERVERPSEPQMLLAGKHTVKIETPGYYPRTESIEVPPGERFAKEYRLVKVVPSHGRAKPCGQFLRPCK